ncbi:MAG: hypothetical protein L3J13_09015, partial [Devosiaceae bacterium]|nr:hypothetical protein [Devosiaceae bacterium]
MALKHQTTTTSPALVFWLIVGWVGFFVLPWYAVEESVFTFSWLFEGWPFNTDVAPAFFQGLAGKKLWLMPLILFLLGPL